MAQLVDLVIDRRILLNIGIRRRHIRLRLIVIVIGNKVFYCIIRKKLLHLPIKLSRQSLIMGNDQGRFI